MTYYQRAFDNKGTVANKLFVGLYCLIIIQINLSSASYFADWSSIGGIGREDQPVCVSIPANMSLCRNIGYTKMRLPNLLEHDTLQEASQQSASWIPLLNVNCHTDSQLFLCSLFAPVCLERPIYPCRSLCQNVKAGCIGTMKSHGFPWPSMLDCDKFPLDNDMCITSQTERNKQKQIKEKMSHAGSVVIASDTRGGFSSNEAENKNNLQCEAKTCNQAGTYENILANYCQADFVVKMKFRQARKRSLWGRKVNTVYKTWRGTPSELKKLRKPKLRLESSDDCCSEWIETQSKKQRYLVMGKKISTSNGNVKLVPSFIHPWNRSKEMKKARRMFKQIDCKNIHETSQRVIAERAHALTRGLQTNFGGSSNSRGSSSQYRSSGRRSRRNKSLSYGINRHQPIGTRFTMSPMEELISVTRSRPEVDNASSRDDRRSKKGKKKKNKRRNQKQSYPRNHEVVSNQESYASQFYDANSPQTAPGNNFGFSRK